jgi:hypothetical protein
MDKFGTTVGAYTSPVPDQLRSLFNHPDDVRVQGLPCVLPGLDSMAVYFGAGARTVPHQHQIGQHLVFVEGVGVVADEDGVHVVRAGDVVSNPPGAWHWHGATTGAAATHVTVSAGMSLDVRSLADNPSTLAEVPIFLGPLPIARAVCALRVTGRTARAGRGGRPPASHALSPRQPCHSHSPDALKKPRCARSSTGSGPDRTLLAGPADQDNGRVFTAVP